MPVALQCTGRQAHRVVNLGGGERLMDGKVEILRLDLPPKDGLEATLSGGDVGSTKPVSEGNQQQ